MNKLQIFNLFLQNIVNWLVMLIEGTIFVEFWLKSSNFEPIVNRLWFFRLGRIGQWHKDAIFVQVHLFIVLLLVICIRLQNTNFLPEQLICPRFWKKLFRKATNDFQQKRKNSGRKHINWSGTGLSQKDPRFLSWLLLSNANLPRLILSSWSVICLLRSFFQNWYLINEWTNSKHLNSKILTKQVTKKLHKFKLCSVQLPHNFALHSAQQSVVLCLKG